MDDLLDLDFAAKPSNQPAKRSAQSAYTGRTAFDYLAQQSANRAPSPASGGVLQPSRTPTPSQRPPPAAASGTSGGDAFANLFGTSPAPAASNGDTGLSMAERLQRESAAKIGGYGGLSGAAGAGGAFGGLSPVAGGGGSRAGSPAFNPPSRGASPASSLLSPTSASSRPLSPSTASSSLSAPAKPADVWDFDLLGSSVPAAKPAPTSGRDDPFDLGFDSLPLAPPAKSPTNGEAPSADDFDLLDAFASPAPPVASRPPPSPSPAPASSARPPPSRSVSPPPHILGHLVEMGFSPAAARSALASTANPSTGGFDVERAVDVLMGGSGSAATAASRPQHQEEEVLDERERRRREKQKRDEDEWGEEDNVKIGRRRSWEFEGDDDAERKERERIERRRRADAAAEQAGASSSAPSASKPPRSREGARSPAAAAGAEIDPNDPAAQLQQQASAALASAQKFGFSMMKSANTFFGQAREAALKAVEEQRAAARAKAGLPPAAGEGGGGGAVPGRPKWWREGMDDEGAEDVASRGKGKARAEGPPATSFKDSDDEGGDPVLQKRPTPRQQQQQPAPSPAAAPAPSEYRSPFRRAKAAPPPAAAPAEADLLSGAPAPPPPSRSPAPAPSRSPAPPSSNRASPSPRPQPSNYRPRPSPSISPSALSLAIKHKSAGNEHFKLGRFGDASASYSAALEALPAGWVGRVLLLNNRAQSRLRSGEEKGAVEDCTEGLEVLLSVFDPPTLAGVDLSALAAESSSLSSPVLELAGSAAPDLKDQLGKSLGRRAKAYEGVEKWAAAKEDWEAILKLGDEVVVKGAGGRKMVNEGAERCRKMLGGPSSSSSSSSAPRPSAPSSKPKPAAAARLRPPPAPVEASGDAVRALQASCAAADAEDDARHALKDSVDAKIVAWKGGKEANLRALIASLENVLWPELGWKKVGMHELVTDNGLKVRYVRAIAKVHPDKLNVNNTTVEQRMIAGLVFAALNDAWNSMK